MLNGICIQTMWRSCGSYFWSKFRSQSEYCSFFEICNEALLDGNTRTLNELYGRALQKRLRHAELSNYYFAEFPVQVSGGVRHFVKRLPYEGYYLEPFVRDDQLFLYIEHLLRYADSLGKIPVMKCARWGLRTAWFRSRFALKCMYVIRSPDAMFRSWWSFGGHESYFVVRSVLIVAKNRDSDLFRDLATRLRVPEISNASIATEVEAARQLCSVLSVQDFRDITLVLWALNLAHNAKWANVLVDVEAMSESDKQLRDVEARIRESLGASIVCSDFRHRETPVAPGRVMSERGCEMARIALGQLGCGLPDVNSVGRPSAAIIRNLECGSA
jgi:hypothetical protein